jgi:hypothetical protein
MVPTWIARLTLAYLLVVTSLAIHARGQDYRMNALEYRIDRQESIRAESRISILEEQTKQQKERSGETDKRLERIENLLIGVVMTIVGQWITTEWRLRQRRRDDDDQPPPPRAPRHRGHREVLDLAEN